jgi:hypothetical protein
MFLFDISNNLFIIYFNRRKGMIIRHSGQLLEQLSQVEEKIQQVEKLMKELELDADSEGLLRTLLAKRYNLSLGQQN